MLFKEIIGQEEIKAKLIDTVRNNRISHAQLLLGPDGSGKLALAIAYAQYINCENKLENDSCGVCHSCSKFAKLIHPDLHFIFPNSSTKKINKDNFSQLFINEFRTFLFENNFYVNLIDWYNALGIENKQGIINKLDCGYITKTLSLKSYESEFTILIIWMVEKIYHSAAPKILKILEEPPDKTLFLLISEDHEQIISTIKSRAQLIKIPRLKNKEIEKALLEIKNCDADTARRIAKLSDGNFTEAIRILNQTELDEYNFQNFSQWMRICFQMDFDSLFKFIDKIAGIGREKQKEFFSYSLKMIREILNLNFQKKYSLKYEGEELIFVEKFSKWINIQNIGVIADELDKALFHIERNANPKILFMDISIKINRLLTQKVKAAV
jgi:DNA polymerase-3 subunit delta'